MQTSSCTSSDFQDFVHAVVLDSRESLRQFVAHMDTIYSIAQFSDHQNIFREKKQELTIVLSAQIRGSKRRSTISLTRDLVLEVKECD